MLNPRGLIPLLPGIFRIDLGLVNAWLITGERPCLVDAGYDRSVPAILAAIEEAGLSPMDIADIVVTHHHPDHAGGLAALREATGARVWMHPDDAALVERGIGVRELHPAPGAINRLLHRALIAGGPGTIPPCPVDERVAGGTVPAGGGLEAIHTPGHSAGHLVFRFAGHGGLLFAGDVASNIPSLRLSIVYEDLTMGRRTLGELGRLDFTVACFGHGSPILHGAAERIRRRWPTPDEDTE